MKTEEVLKALKTLAKTLGWSVRLNYADAIRLKGPGDKRHFWNPLGALVFHLKGFRKRAWRTPGEELGLDSRQIDDFHRACDLRWFRPRLRLQILEACGLEDKKFEGAMQFVDTLFPKSKLEKILKSTSSKDRMVLEEATRWGAMAKVEEILKKY